MSRAPTPRDEAHLRRALELAAAVRRRTAPNPAVGCVLAHGARVVGEGATAARGGPHAEASALAAAGAAARGATAYVTLEPCSHQGRTPPCADALIAAGVARVVAAAGDPAPHVGGAGFARLAAAGVAVEVLDVPHPLAIAARRQQAGHRMVVAEGRPFVLHKAAATLDGRTATRDGDSRWVSSAESRSLVHAWRAEAGAVLVGIGTALADDPSLTARDTAPVPERQPLRVVADRSARLPVDGTLARTAREVPVVVLVAPAAPADRRAALEAAGVETLAVGSLRDGLAALVPRGVTEVLSESGATLAGALVAEGLVDRFALFVAPLLLGDDGARGLVSLPVGATPPDRMASALRAAHLTATNVGPDILLDAWLHEPR